MYPCVPYATPTVVKSSVSTCFCCLQAALEDSLVTMSTILSSRFVAGIRGEVEKVERQLTNFSETLDQWVQVRQVLAAAQMLQPCSVPCQQPGAC